MFGTTEKFTITVPNATTKLGNASLNQFGKECRVVRGGRHPPNIPSFTPEALKANQPLLDLIRKVAQEKNATPAQIAIAWLLAQEP
jgi:aryl-alcohol dehydrogenase-like predicted oxidoreductase